MADEQQLEDSGLFAIGLAASDTEDEETSNHNKNKNKNTHTKQNDRTGQSEEQFQLVRKSYRAKAENGEIWKSVQLPLGKRKVPKHEAQELLHAVEELYFYRRYEEGLTLVGRMFDGEDGAQGVDRDTRELLRTYERKCLEKLGRE